MTAVYKGLKKSGRDRLIAASLKLFSHKGFHACSVREICEAAKANISLVSFHFGGKEGLLDVIFEELIEQDFNRLNESLSTVSSKEDLKIRLNVFLVNYVEFSIKHGDVISLYLEELERGNKQAVEILPKTYGKLWQTLNQFLQLAKDKKIIDESIDVEIQAFQILSPINHLIRSRYTSSRTTMFSLKDESFRKKLVNQIVKSAVL
jgi:TetR/AcrR family transcriptional regulator, regulator of cefoperazone and chloramphenicol sensitivity